MQIPLSKFRGQYKPPGIPRINWQHPITNGLIFYAYDTGCGANPSGGFGGTGNYGVQPGIIELAQHRIAFLGGIAQSNTQLSPFGSGIRYNASYSCGFVADTATRDLKVFTAACGYFQTATQTGNNRCFGRTANNGSSPFLNWDWEATAGGNVNFNMLNSSSSIITVASPAQVSNKYCTVMTTNDNVTARAYFNGTQVGSTANANPVGINSGDALVMGGASVNATAAPWTGLSFYGAYWKRTLTAAEAELLHYDPYCFLIYPSDFAYSLLVGSASAPTFKPAWAAKRNMIYPHGAAA